MDGRKHVFILGAGFSFPLGGPLFTQILSAELHDSAKQILQQYDEAIQEAVNRLVSNDRKRSIDSVFHRFLNAEELLERIDYCLRFLDDGESSSLLRALGYSSNLCTPENFLLQVVQAVKKVVAVQCNQFLERMIKDKKSERWDAYEAWFSKLDDDDTIITFNYDRVVETVASRLERHLPTEPGRMASGNPHLLKLHGSIDWITVNNNVKYCENAFAMGYGELCIAIPGQGKSDLRSLPTMDSMWKTAERRIEEADFISIIGYSMPESDNRARLGIVNSIGKNRQRLRVDLVMGISEPARVRRVVSMIQPILAGRGRVFDTSMYAQDYLPNFGHYRSTDYFN